MVNFFEKILLDLFLLALSDIYNRCSLSAAQVYLGAASVFHFPFVYRPIYTIALIPSWKKMMLWMFIICWNASKSQWMLIADIHKASRMFCFSYPIFPPMSVNVHFLCWDQILIDMSTLGTQMGWADLFSTDLKGTVFSCMCYFWVWFLQWKRWIKLLKIFYKVFEHFRNNTE